jgi:hypothetical protein
MYLEATKSTRGISPQRPRQRGFLHDELRRTAMKRQESAFQMYGYKQKKSARMRVEEEEQYHKELKKRATSASTATAASWAATYLNQDNEGGSMNNVLEELKKETSSSRKKKKKSSSHRNLHGNTSTNTNTKQDEYSQVNDEVMKMQQELKQRIRKRNPVEIAAATTTTTKIPLGTPSLYNDDGDVKSDRRARLESTKKSILNEIRRKSTRRTSISKNKSSSSAAANHDHDYGLLGSTKSNVLEELKKRSKKKKRKPSRMTAASGAACESFMYSRSTDGTGSYDDDEFDDPEGAASTCSRSSSRQQSHHPDAAATASKSGSTYSRSARQQQHHDEEGSRGSSSRRDSNNNNNAGSGNNSRSGRTPPINSSSSWGMDHLVSQTESLALLVPDIDDDANEYDCEVQDDDGYSRASSNTNKSRFFQNEEPPFVSRGATTTNNKSYLLQQYDYGNSSAAHSKTKDFLHSELKKRVKSPSRSRSLMYKYGNYSRDGGDDNNNEDNPHESRRSSLHQELEKKTASRRRNSPKCTTSMPSQYTDYTEHDEERRSSLHKELQTRAASRRSSKYRSAHDDHSDNDSQIRRSSLHQELQSRTASLRSPKRSTMPPSYSGAGRDATSNLHSEIKSRRVTEPHKTSSFISNEREYQPRRGSNYRAARSRASFSDNINDSDGKSSLNDQIRNRVQRVAGDNARPRRGSSYYIPGITSRPSSNHKTANTVETEATSDDEFAATSKSTFFIPGINGTARCLNDEKGNTSRPRRRTSTTMSASSGSSVGSRASEPAHGNASVATGLSARTGATRSSATSRGTTSRRALLERHQSSPRRSSGEAGASSKEAGVDLDDIIRGARSTKNLLSSPTKSKRSPY